MTPDAHDTINVASLFNLTGKIALVTGGSRGIGKMIAEGYLQAGATVYISSRKAAVCDQVATELSAAGPCHSLPADVADDNDRARLVAELGERTDRLDILVNNAGAAWGADYSDFPASGFRKVLELNVTALFFLTRDLTPLLATAASPDDPARVINIGSMDGIKVPTVLETGTFPYSASKAAVHHMTRTLAVELAPRDITVNAIAPGFFESKMTEASLERYRDNIEQNCPLGRIGRPEEMAGVAIYLASRAGAYTNGAVIPVDGGTCVA
ncbi:MAG: SDR family oxidoreductase [Vicinamibacterales bacterium]|nr:SDR family oxidoreductase [Vicinamibacterales bacterium]